MLKNLENSSQVGVTTRAGLGERLNFSSQMVIIWTKSCSGLAKTLLFTPYAFPQSLWESEPVRNQPSGQAKNVFIEEPSHIPEHETPAGWAEPNHPNFTAEQQEGISGAWCPLSCSVNNLHPIAIMAIKLKIRLQPLELWWFIVG